MICNGIQKDVGAILFARPTVRGFNMSMRLNEQHSPHDVYLPDFELSRTEHRINAFSICRWPSWSVRQQAEQYLIKLWESDAKLRNYFETGKEIGEILKNDEEEQIANTCQFAGQTTMLVIEFFLANLLTVGSEVPAPLRPRIVKRWQSQKYNKRRHLIYRWSF